MPAPIMAPIPRTVAPRTVTARLSQGRTSAGIGGRPAAGCGNPAHELDDGRAPRRRLYAASGRTSAFARGAMRPRRSDVGS